jgi:hypothetical protein
LTELKVACWQIAKDYELHDVFANKLPLDKRLHSRLSFPFLENEAAREFKTDALQCYQQGNVSRGSYVSLV